MFKRNLRGSFFTLGLLLWASAAAFAQSTAFTYQGKLADTGNPANGPYDLQFKLVYTIHFAETSDGVALVCPATLLR